MKKVLLLLTVLFFSSQLLTAQRYVSEVFDDSDIMMQENVVYGVNATVLLLAQVGQAVPQPLLCDVYYPGNDDVTDRPLAIIVHTGNFLPPAFNGGCGGTQKDNDVVQTARQLARMGYVAACIDYRLGWDPTNPEQDVRVYTIINAAYRGLQDVNTSIKFFRRTVAENDNPYGIDPNKVMTVGFGTGAYTTYGASTVATAEETWTGPYVTSAGPMVLPMFNGDPSADTFGVIPDTGVPGLPFPPGDTLCYPNHVGFDDKAQLSVQFGGALGDIAWVTEDDTPMVSFHVKTDPFAPCVSGTVLVPPPVNEPVVEVFGACSVLPAADALGINDVFNGIDYDDAWTAAANANNDGVDGLYLMFSDDATESSPWNAADNSAPYGPLADGTIPECDTWTQEVQDVRDSTYNYIAPRACIALDLGCDLSGFTNIEELDESTLGLTIAPNPANEFVRLSTENAPMTEVFVFDMQGKLVRAHQNIGNYQFQLNKGNLTSGMYLTMIRFKDGYVTKKVVFE